MVPLSARLGPVDSTALSKPHPWYDDADSAHTSRTSKQKTLRTPSRPSPRRTPTTGIYGNRCAPNWTLTSSPSDRLSLNGSHYIHANLTVQQLSGENLKILVEAKEVG